jgi:hypothetical protein
MFIPENIINSKRSKVLAGLLCATLAAGFVAKTTHAQNGDPLNAGSANEMTLAVFGDWPYTQNLYDTAALLINSINADPKVRLVLHVGDIHSGSMPCTGALGPKVPTIPKTSNPAWNQNIFNLFEQFKDPVVYTPGDNEWTDCHKTAQGTSGYPLYELAAVRGLFFTNPGYTLGGRKKQVLSQALVSDGRFSTDAQFVENVMWEESQVLFVTLNVPGSNDDTLPWSGGTAAVPGSPYPAQAFLDEPARKQEVTERDAANSRWLSLAFDQAEQDHVKAVLVVIQADMWDTTAALTAYTPFVNQLAGLAVSFGGPVLLINGDSHVFEKDHPLADPGSTLGQVHKVPFAVPNLTRITVEGSTTLPHEWLRLTIDPHSSDIFSTTNVIYCSSDPCSM